MKSADIASDVVIADGGHEDFTDGGVDGVGQRRCSG